MADKADDLFLQKEGSQPAIILRTGNLCWFCGNLVDRDNPDNYRQVESWVSGPKLDHPVLRTQTGNMAHKECVDKVKMGQAPDQEELF